MRAPGSSVVAVKVATKLSLSTTCLSCSVKVVGEMLRQLPAAEVAMEHLLAVLPRIPVVAAAEEILMTGNVPSNYTPYPDYSWSNRLTPSRTA